MVGNGGSLSEYNEIFPSNQKDVDNRNSVVLLEQLEDVVVHVDSDNEEKEVGGSAYLQNIDRKDAYKEVCPSNGATASIENCKLWYRIWI